MNKNILGLLVMATVGAGVFTYGRYGSVIADRGEETSLRSESGVIVDEVLSAPMFPPKVSDENGVTVTVTPLLVSSDVATWEFDVVMSTHVVELGAYDLKEMTTLADGSGKTYKPLSWGPDATEGHHIGGVLQFERPITESNTVIVKIAGVGGSGERVFAWQKQ